MIQAKVFHMDTAQVMEKQINDFLKNNTFDSAVSISGSGGDWESKLVVFYRVEKQ
jgi:hypothetical protein